MFRYAPFPIRRDDYAFSRWKPVAAIPVQVSSRSFPADNAVTAFPHTVARCLASRLLSSPHVFREGLVAHQNAARHIAHATEE